MYIKTPIFLVGAERSGTTLLRLMLDHHPQIAFHYEFEFAVDRIDDKGNLPKLEEYYDYLAYHRIFLSSQLRINHDLTYVELMNDFLKQKQQQANKPVIGATIHHHFDKLILLWSHAKFIHLIRDGRDVARSNIMMGWAGNMFTGTDRWIEAEKLWQKLSEQLAPEQQITIHYEQLIRDSRTTLQQLCQFIGVEFDEKIYDYAQQSTYELPDPKILERWRRFKPIDIQLAESKIADLLTQWHYPLSGLPLLPITPVLRWRMYLHSRWRGILFRINRYSFSLYLQDVLSRRLGFNHWQKRVRIQLNECDKKFLK